MRECEWCRLYSRFTWLILSYSFSCIYANHTVDHLLLRKYLYAKCMCSNKQNDIRKATKIQRTKAIFYIVRYALWISILGIRISNVVHFFFNNHHRIYYVQRMQNGAGSCNKLNAFFCAKEILAKCDQRRLPIERSFVKPFFRFLWRLSHTGLCVSLTAVLSRWEKHLFLFRNS